MRVHKINNVNKALDFIASKGVKLVSIGAEGESAPLPPHRGPIRAAPPTGKARRPPPPSPRPPCGARGPRRWHFAGISKACA